MKGDGGGETLELAEGIVVSRCSRPPHIVADAGCFKGQPALCQRYLTCRGCVDLRYYYVARYVSREKSEYRPDEGYTKK